MTSARDVYSLDGKCLAHINERVLGKNMWDQRDVDGKYFTRERLEAAKDPAERLAGLQVVTR